MAFLCIDRLDPQKSARWSANWHQISSQNLDVYMSFHDIKHTPEDVFTTSPPFFPTSPPIIPT